MGMFTETTIIDYRLTFAEQKKKNYVFNFCLQQTNGSLTFRFSVYSKQREVAGFH
jgi:hypothetical protein